MTFCQGRAAADHPERPGAVRLPAAGVDGRGRGRIGPRRPVRPAAGEGRRRRARRRRATCPRTSSPSRSRRWRPACPPDLVELGPLGGGGVLLDAGPRPRADPASRDGTRRRRAERPDADRARGRGDARRDSRAVDTGEGRLGLRQKAVLRALASGPEDGSKALATRPAATAPRSAASRSAASSRRARSSAAGLRPSRRSAPRATAVELNRGPARAPCGAIAESLDGDGGELAPARGHRLGQDRGLPRGRPRGARPRAGARSCSSPRSR